LKNIQCHWKLCRIDWDNWQNGEPLEDNFVNADDLTVTNVKLCRKLLTEGSHRFLIILNQAGTLPKRLIVVCGQ
jgi:enolase